MPPGCGRMPRPRILARTRIEDARATTRLVAYARGVPDLARAPAGRLGVHRRRASPHGAGLQDAHAHQEQRSRSVCSGFASHWMPRPRRRRDRRNSKIVAVPGHRRHLCPPSTSRRRASTSQSSLSRSSRPPTRGTIPAASSRFTSRSPSLWHYLVVHQDRRQIVHHQRRDDLSGAFLTNIAPPDPLRLDPPGIDLSFAAVYDGVPRE